MPATEVIGLFAAIGRFSYRFRWPMIAVWIVAFALGLAAVPRLRHELKGGDFSNPGAPAQQALDLMQRRLHTASPRSPRLHESTFDAPGPHFGRPRLGSSPASRGDDSRPADRADLCVERRYDPRVDRPQDLARHLVFDRQIEQAQQQVDRSGPVAPRRSQAYITGDPAVYQALETSRQRPAQGRDLSLPFALIVLVLVFGSVVAAALPVVGGGMAVTRHARRALPVAQRFSLSIFTMNVASLLGLAVGIDYSLFIVGRFREELARAERRRRRRDDRRPRRTAIFFSGIAVIVGLSGLLMFSYMSLRSIGLSGAIVSCSRYSRR